MTDQETPQELRVERSADYRLVFSNSFRFRFSAGDGSITFSQFTETPGSATQNIVQEQINVTMTLPQIKMLGEYLTIAVQELEREIGPIVSVGLPKEELQKQAIAIIKSFAIQKK